MRSLVVPGLSLDCRFSSKSCVRRRIDELFEEVSGSHGVSDKSFSKLEDYANSLRDEMKKIDAFKRELPLCMLLLNEAIVAAEEELAQFRKSNAEPVFEEFIPLKKICEDEEVDIVESTRENDISCRDKMNWMSSVQLCDPETNQLTLKLGSSKKRTEEEMNRPVMDNLSQSCKNRTVGIAISPLKGCMNFPVQVGKDMDELPVPALSLCTAELKKSNDRINPIGFSPKSCSSRSGSPSATNVQSNSKTGQNQSARKQRRCWSQELHRQFINALQQLGGAQAATPKQIRDLMQVDGLTNDEVKSHLQKFRLHSQRHSSNSSFQSIGLWMSEEQFYDSSKKNDSQSGSPDGPLHLDGSPNGNSGGNEDEDDEGHIWKGDIQLNGRDGV